MPDEQDDLTVAHREVLRSWGRDWQPPESLRERTVRAVTDEGRPGAIAPRRARRFGAFAWAAAVAAVAFVVGVGIGQRQVRPVPPQAQRYMLLLFESDEYRVPRDEEELRQRESEYVAWARRLADGGRFVDGEELSQAGWRYGLDSGRLTRLPPADDPMVGVLAGYFVVGAASEDDAVALLEDCPHLAYGGTVEVRMIESH